ncbi:NAD(P)-binding protein [Rhizophagus irregularis]|uniref:NAD(P)-binding protein n=1 Tax=Rhizophagus irregularis TaxID=588596 RepID=A0A2N1MS97_9GLOM|nr:NAD(P)-binding protein [Rhizophagus irregularis]
MSSQFKTVTIAGGTGNLGYHIAEAFLNDGSYYVKILRRKPKTENEKAKLLASKGAEIVYADYDQKDDLVNVLKGTDVIISTLSDSNANLYDSQTPLLAAAKEASVKRFIPSEFGFEVGVHQITDGKIRFEEEVIKSGLEYTIIYNGLFQEFLGWIGFDVKNKKATFYADGNKKLHTTSLSDVGKYTIETLKMPEARNSFIKVAGVTLSLNEYLQKFEEISGENYIFFF